MVREIVKAGNEILRASNADVVVIDDEVKGIIEDMKDTLLANNETGLGLAAPQIGVNKKIIVIRENLNCSITPLRMKGLFVMINPIIIKESKKTVVYREGCMSIPEQVCDVTRHKEIKVKYIDADGNNTVRNYEDTDAVVIQHEIDHLHGILACDPERAINITPAPSRQAKVETNASEEAEAVVEAAE
jgi:peptide deformylase